MSRQVQHGFSLIELAVVLVIVGLLVGGGIAALDATQTQSLRAEQKRQLANVREALYGFAMQEGRLPCPDDPANGLDGEQDHDGTNCDTDTGALPHAALGVGYRDAWGYPLYYAVDSDPFAGFDTDGGSTSTFQLNPDPPSYIDVVDTQGGDTVAAEIPALVLSFGPQGGQVWTAGGFVCPGGAAGFSADETENCDGNGTFVDAGYRNADSSDGRFDDLLTWLPEPVLAMRLVNVDKLPRP